MPAELQASRQDACLILTIRSPGAENTLHPDIYAAAIETLATAERDESIRSVILTGSRSMFCGGTSASSHAAESADVLNALSALQGWIEAILDCPKPVIAAVEGMAAGAGFALALASDFIVAGRSAAFSLPAVKSGLTPDAGLWFLAQALPRQAAGEILIAGKPATAARMHQLGVVNCLCEDGEAMNTAMAWAEELATFPPDAVERIKAMLRQAPAQPLGRHMDMEKQNFMECLSWRRSQKTT